MNRFSRWLFKRLCKGIDTVIISATVDTKQPVITFSNAGGQHFASLWLHSTLDDDTYKIRTVTPY